MITDGKRGLANMDGDNQEVHTLYPKGMNQADSILIRLKEAAGAENDAQLADFIGINRQGIVKAKKKGTLPPSWLLLISEKTSYSLDWLYYGYGNRFKRSYELPNIDAENFVNDLAGELIGYNNVATVTGHDSDAIYDFVMSIMPQVDNLIIISDIASSLAYLFILSPKNQGLSFFVERAFSIKSDHERRIVENIKRIALIRDCAVYTGLGTHAIIYKFMQGIPSIRKDSLTCKKLFEEIAKNFSLERLHEEANISPSSIGISKSLTDDIEGLIRSLKELKTDEETIKKAVQKLIEER